MKSPLHGRNKKKDIDTHSNISNMTPHRNDMSASYDNTKVTVKLFEQKLRTILDKFSKSHTTEQAHEEIRSLMKNDVSDNDRMMLFLTSLTEFNIHVQTSQKCEQIKVFGVAAEIFEDSLVPYLPKVLAQLAK